MTSTSGERSPGPAVRPLRNPDPFSIRRILVPIDFSEYSKGALRYAVAFARTVRAELTLVYVVEPAIYPADFSFGQVALPNVEVELRDRGETELQELAKIETQGTVPVTTLVRTGKPFLEICTLAEERQIDLIIIATHGHTGVEHLLFGGTAEKVVRKAPCNVLVVRPEKGPEPVD